MPEWETVVISCRSAATFTVLGEPAVIKGFYVNTVLSAHQAEFRNATAMVFKTPKSAAEGDAVDWDEAKFGTNCLVVCGASMTGNFTVLYKSMRHGR